MKYVGKVGVRVVPDARDFERKIRQLESQRPKTVMDVLLDSRRILEERKRLERPIEFEVHPKVHDEDLVKIREEVASYRDELQKTENIDPAVSWGEARSQLTGARREAEALRDASNEAITHAREQEQAVLDSARALNTAKARVEELSKSAEGLDEIPVKLRTAQAAYAEAQRSWQQASDAFEAEGHKRLAAAQEDARAATKRIEALDHQVEALDALRVKETAVTAAVEKRWKGASLEQLESALQERKNRITDSFDELSARLAVLRKETERNIKIHTETDQTALTRLQAELKRLGDPVTKRLRVEADIKNAENRIAELKARLSGDLTQTTRIRVNADIRAAQQRIETLKQSFKALDEEADRRRTVQLEIKQHGDNIAKITESLKEAATQHKAELKIDVDNAKLEIKRVERDLKKLEEHRKTELEVEAQTRIAKMEIARAARNRVATIFVKASGINQVRQAMEGLTGFSMFAKMRDNLLAMATSMDTTLLKVSALIPVLSWAAANITQLVPGIINFLHGFVQIAPAALVGATAVGSLGTAFAVLRGALKGLDKTNVEVAQNFYAVWQDARARFEGLQDIVQGAFHSEELTSEFQALADNILPQLESGIGGVATAAGDMARELIAAFDTAITPDKLTGFLDQTADAITRVAPGMRALVEALSNLALTGGQYLGPMSDWLSETIKGWAEWTADADKVTGKIDNAVSQFKSLKSAAADALAVLGVLMDTANASGADIGGFIGISRGLSTLRSGVEAVKPGLEGLFEGAHAGANAFVDALNGLGPQMNSILSFIGRIINQGGQAFAGLANNLVGVLSSPAVQSGAENFVSTINQVFATTDFSPLSDAIGTILDALAPLIPSIVDIALALAPVAADMVQSFAGVAKAIAPILPSLAPILPWVLGLGALAGPVRGLAGALSGARTALSLFSRGGRAAASAASRVGSAARSAGGFLSNLAGRGGAAASAFAGLGGRLAAVAGRLGSVFAGVLPRLTGVFAGIGRVFMPLVTGAGAAFAQVGSLVTGFISIIGPAKFAIAAVVAGAAALFTALGISAANASEHTDEMSASLDEASGSMAGMAGNGKGLIAGLAQNIAPALQGIGKAFGDILPKIGDAFKGILPTLGNTLRNVASSIGTVFSDIGPKLGDAFGKILPAITNTLASILPTIASVFGQIATTVGRVIGDLAPIIGNLVSSLLPVLGTVFNTVGTVLAELLPVIGTVAGTLVGSLAPAFLQLAETLGPVVASLLGQLLPVFGNIVAAIGPVVEALVGALLPALTDAIGVVTQVVEALAPLFEQLGPMLAENFAQMASAIGTTLQGVGDVIRGFMAALNGDWSQAWELIRSGALDILDRKSTR